MPSGHWRIRLITPTLLRRGCVARQEPYIPGALSILQGTVPDQVRGPGHMVPTYFRRCSGIECFNGHRGFALLLLMAAALCAAFAVQSWPRSPKMIGEGPVLRFRRLCGQHIVQHVRHAALLTRIELRIAALARRTAPSRPNGRQPHNRRSAWAAFPRQGRQHRRRLFSLSAARSIRSR